MNAVVVDTDVVSLVFKADSRAEKYVSALSAPDLIVRWAEVMVVARCAPWAGGLKLADAWVAATALLYDAPLLTNNPGDYVGVAGIKLLPNK